MRFYKLFLIIVIVFLCHSCSKDDSGLTDQNSEVLGNVFYTNSSDPLFLTLEEDNSVINFYGNRDSDGIPVKATHIQMLESDSIENLITLGDNNMPESFIASNGVQFQLEWIDSNRIVFTAISGDGETQINTLVNLNDTQESKIRNEPKEKVAKRKGKLQLISRSQAGFDLIGEVNNQNTMSNTARLFVTECNMPVNRQVRVDVTTNDFFPSDRKVLRSIFPKQIKTGVYEAAIPSGLTKSVNPQEVCRSISSILDAICLSGIGNPNLTTAICLQLTRSIAATGIGAAKAGEFFVACEFFGLLFNRYCAIASEFPSGTSICDLPFLNFEITQDIMLQGVGIALPKNIRGRAVPAEANGPYPDITLDFGNETILSGFILEPSNPVAGENYNAVAKVLCVKPLSQITISIIGTDGFQDSMTFKVDAETASENFVLNVPGAESGVRDECIVEIEFFDGTKTIRRMASLIFN